MSHAQTVLVLILMQQTLVAAAWLGAAWGLRVSGTAALHWAAASALVGVALGLYALVGVAPDAWTHGLGNALVPACFVLLRRGLQRFLRRPYSDIEHLVVAGGSALLIAVGWQLDAPESLPILVASAAPAWCLARMAMESHGPAAEEFGPAPARAFTAVMGGLALIFASRLVGGFFVPELAARPVGVDTPLNTVLVMAFMVIGLALQMALGLMVVLRLAQRLAHLSRHDTLTGLPNRRVMQDAVARARAHHARRGTPFAVLAVDVDHFKRINDSHGHAAGDQALVHLARVLRESLRSDDCIARMGGEEFCVLLGNCHPAEALGRAERLRNAVAAAPVLVPGGTTHTMTVSVGLADCPATAGTPETSALLHRADEALYAAKRSGRNRVVVAPA
jgi:diguanylate cyclase (GGDEF)-like protein